MKNLIKIVLLMLSAVISLGCGQENPEVAVASVTLNKSEIYMTVGDSPVALVATVNPSNATNQNVSFRSDNTSVASVTGTGVVTAIKEGKANITVTTEDGGKTAVCVVTVNPKEYRVTKVKLDKTKVTLTEGDEITLTAEVSPVNATNKKVTWQSTNESVATVIEGTVTARAAGNATVIVKTEDGGFTAQCEIIVEPKVYPVERVELNQSSAQMTVGDEITLTATIYPANATNKDVRWSSSNAAVVSVENGKVTAREPGTAIITVTTVDGEKSATCQITVDAKVYPVEKVELNKTKLTLVEGETETLIAIFYPANATNKNVTWQSTNESVATVDSNGKVSAHKAGTSTITVTTEDRGKTAVCEVTVNPKVYPVEKVELNKTKLTLEEGENETLLAIVSPDNATNKKVSWQSTSESVATVDSNGKVSAIKAGSTTIIATTEDGGKKAVCEVTVNPKVYPVERVSLDKSELTLSEGEEETLVASVYPDNATNKKVTWQSSNESVATVLEGTVTAKMAGEATIVVKTDDGGFTARCKVIVNPKVYQVESVKLSKSELTLTEDEEQVLIATVYPDNATNKNVTWTSTDGSVASVDSNGKVTAHKAGYTTIRVTTEDGGKTATCGVTVKAKHYPVERVGLSHSSVQMTEGDLLTLTATVYPLNATDKSVRWSSSNTTVAVVENGVVTAYKEGTAVITVSSVENSSISATCVVTVNPKIYNVEYVELNRYEIELAEKDQFTLQATVYPSNATNKKVIWSSSDKTVAEVSQNGLVTALKAGVAKITVTTEDGGKTAVCEVTVLKEYGNEEGEKLEDEDGEW